MNDNNYLLEIENIYLNYGSIRAVNGISMKIKRGEIISLIGANGAGKSSLLKAIVNIEKNKGKKFFKGEDISNNSTEKIVSKGISIIPEGHLIFSSLTVLENLKLGVFQGNNSTNMNLDKIYEYFPVLKERKNQKAKTLSGGEQQMLSIGRALLSGPELLLVDEPSLGLAPQVVNDIFDILKKLNEDGFTILLSEQNLRKSLQIADRAYLIKKGKIAKKAKSEELLKHDDFNEIYLK